MYCYYVKHNNLVKMVKITKNNNNKFKNNKFKNKTSNLCYLMLTTLNSVYFNYCFRYCKKI